MNLLQKLLSPLDSDTSLLAVCRLGVFADKEGLVFWFDRGTMRDLGFATNASLAIRDRPFQAVIGPLYSDKFLFIKDGQVRGALGKVVVSEAYVYDEQYRADIDFTGFKLEITLNSTAFMAYRDFIGLPRRPSISTSGGWNGLVALRMPARCFQFPKPRGSDPPFPPAGATVRTLRRIASFKISELDAIKLPGWGECMSEQPPPVMTDDRLQDALHLRHRS